MSDEKPDSVPPFPMDDNRSVGFHVAMGTLDAAASLVPGASYGVQQLVRQFIGEPLERRREAWFTSLGLGVRELRDRLDGFDPSSLGENEEFISTVAEITRIAMATHRAEKLETLRNVVLSAAAGLTLDDVARGTFMALVERFSALHLQVVRVLRDPLASPEIQAIGGEHVMMAIRDALCRAFQASAGAHTIDVVLGDLSDTRLTQGVNSAAVTPDPLTSRCLTPLGGSFAKFISSPLA